MAKIISSDQVGPYLTLYIYWFNHKQREAVTFIVPSNIEIGKTHLENDIGDWFSHRFGGESITFDVPPNMLKNMPVLILCAAFLFATEKLDLSIQLLDERDYTIGSLIREIHFAKPKNTEEKYQPLLIKAIRRSKISIIIFSKNYASSSWCLDELERILENRRRSFDQLVIPIFLYVDPSDVRHHRGSFEEALAEHEESSNKKKEKVPKWKMALTEASNLSGFHLRKNGDESRFIQKIVEEAWKKIESYTSTCCQIPSWN
nr:protein SUPPRESSOR OF npr1-1, CONSTITUTIVE 1-like [Ziziphus jujuba var. spinosa]